MVTFHPCGFTHGPHPKALKNMLKQAKPATDEVAVMVDARDPLHVADDLPANVENTSYVNSWRPQETG
jgi:homogentisate 1,2-dioxygenase